MTYANSFTDTLQKYRSALPRDLVAGITAAVAGAPQAMAFAIIAGVSPIYGLYAAIVANTIGSLAGSSTYMTVGTTNAIALVVGSALNGYEGAAQIEHLFTLTFLIGAFLLLFGLLRLGDLTRFVSNAVMTGFITGAGLLIIMGQLRHITGYDLNSGTTLQRFGDWLIKIPDSHLQTVIIGFIAVCIIYAIRRTRFKNAATLVAIVTTSVFVTLFDWESVLVVADISHIPSGLPGMKVPDFALVPKLITAAFATAVLAAVQSAAISQTVREPDGSRANANRDFIGQGLANIVGGFFQALPAGGSLSRTAINVNAGAETRMANFYAGLFIGIIVITLGSLIEHITMAALAAQLIIAAISLIRIKDIRTVWNVNRSARVSMVITFISTLVLPLEYSIYVGVAISLLLYNYTSARRIEIVRIMPVDRYHYREAPAPAKLPTQEPVILFVHGSLYFAAARNLETRLPQPNGARQPIVILRLRDNQYLGSTGLEVLRGYAHKLEACGGKLILAGIGDRVRNQLERTHAANEFGSDAIFYATDVIFESTEQALTYAQEWLATHPLNEP